jgi:uncharacterized membrane protein YphA (DoxX/SURF4 family)
MATVIRQEPPQNPVLNIFLQILRIAVGLLFIFSGVVKANDPMGLANKMTEFFEPAVWNMPYMIPYALLLSVMMIAFEIIAGMALLLGFAFRAFSLFLLLLNIFFTLLTAYVYYWDVIMHSAKVRECGCFGDCIKISNSETFWKDVALLIAALILFIFRNRIKPLLPKYPNTAIFILSIFFAFGVQWWALEHLPFYDCMPYKVGNNILEKRKLPPGATPAVYESIFYYKKDGITKEYTQDNLPWEDTTWVFVDRKDKLIKEAVGEAEIKDFTVSDFAGNDYTEPLLTDPGYTYLLFIKNPVTARTDNMDRLQRLIKDAQKKRVNFYVLSSGPKEATEAWKEKWNLQGVELYTIDGTANKTALRSDPGLILIKAGTIKGKWSFRDYPDKAPD